MQFTHIHASQLLGTLWGFSCSVQSYIDSSFLFPHWIFPDSQRFKAQPGAVVLWHELWWTAGCLKQFSLLFNSVIVPLSKGLEGEIIPLILLLSFHLSFYFSCTHWPSHLFLRCLLTTSKGGGVWTCCIQVWVFCVGGKSNSKRQCVKTKSCIFT